MARLIRKLAAPPDPDLPAMLEVDLLPSWYPELVRRRRWLHFQAWGTCLLILVLAGVLGWRKAYVQATHVELATLVEQRKGADEALEAVEAAEARLSSLLAQAEMVGRMGLPVEVSRVLLAIDAAAPPDVALTLLEVRTEQRVLPMRGGGRAPTAVRQMRFKIAGLAETYASAYDLSQALESQPLLRADGVPLLREVQLSNQAGLLVQGREAVAFELTFYIDLASSLPGGGVSEARGGL